MTPLLKLLAPVALGLAAALPFAPRTDATAPPQDGEEAPRRAVLVTGASTGIGRRTAEVLVSVIPG